MMEGSNHEEMKKFLEVLGLREEPLGMYYQQCPVRILHKRLNFGSKYSFGFL